MKFIYFYLFFLFLTGCKFELPEALKTRNCNRNISINYSVDNFNPLKYSFIVSNISNIEYPIIWQTNTGLVLGKSNTNDFSYTFSSAGTFNIKTSFRNSCGDSVGISFRMDVLNSQLTIERNLILTEPIIGSFYGKTLVTNSGIVINKSVNNINVWDYRSQTLINSFKNSSGIIAGGMVLSKDENFLYTTSGNIAGEIVKVNWKTSEIVKSIYSNPVSSIRSLNISGNGIFLTFYTYRNGKNVVVLYNLITSTFKTLEVDYDFLDLSISNDGRRICISNINAKEAYIYNIDNDSENFSKIWTFKSFLGSVNCLKISPDGKYIINGDFFASNELRKYQIWNIDLKSKEYEIYVEGSNITNEITFSDDGLFVTLNGNVLFDFENKKILYTRNINIDKTPLVGNFSQNGKYLVASINGSIELYTTSPINILARNSFNKNQSLFLSGKISPDGNFIVTSDNYGFKIWDTNSGEVIFHDLSIRISDFNYSTEVEKINFRKNAIWFVNNGNVFKLDLSSKTISKVTNTNNVSFLNVSEDESIYGVHIGTEIQLYSANNKLIRTLGNSPGNILTAFKISFDNKYLLGPSTNNTIKVFEMSSGQLLRSFGDYSITVPLNFSNTNSEVIAAFNYGQKKLNVYNFITGEALNSISKIPYFSRILLSPDNKTVVGLSFSTLVLMDLTSNSIKKTREFGDNIISVVFNQSGSKLNVLTQRGFFTVNTE